MKRFLVTAGNTRESIDRVRDWGNIFTGNTGYAIARALSVMGEVTLLTSNAAHIEEIGRTRGRILARGFRSHAQLKEMLAGLVSQVRYDAIFMTAAVADYRPQRVYVIQSREVAGDGVERWVVKDVQKPKVSGSYDQIAVIGERTEKVVDLFRTVWGFGGMLVKFKLEVGVSVEELLRIGGESRRASGADWLVANTLEMVEGVNPGAYLIGEQGHEWVPRDRLPTRMAELAAQR